jgi:hypothetical protein
MQANKPNKQVHGTERKIIVLTLFFELAYQGKDIEFRFIILYSSSLRDLAPRSIFIRGFLKDNILTCVET